MHTSEATLNVIQDQLRLGHPYERVAKKAGVSVDFVRNYDIVANKRFVVSEDGQGRPEMRKYIVAIRHADRHWDKNKYPGLDQARRDYDAGRIEMITGRDGFNFILYAIPRTEIAKKRRVYFSRNFGDG
jgi:hypothetical protein